MPIFRITAPDGNTYEVTAPEGATAAQALARVKAQHAQPAKSGVKGTGTYGLPAQKSDLASSFAQGGAFGLLDEIAGGAGAAVDAIRSPFSKDVDFNPAKSYQAWRDRSRGGQAETSKAHPVLAPAMEFAGGLGTAGKAIAASIAKAPLLKQVGKGAAVGAGAGGLSGFGYGEGLDNSIRGAEWGAGLGGIFGSAAPVAVPALIDLLGSGAKGAKSLARYITGKAVPTAAQKAQGLGRKVVAKAMVDDSITPLAAGKALDAAHGRGAPLALADLGDNLRGLTGSLSRKPGTPRRLVRQMVDDRQLGQGERVRGAISRDLGDVANPFETSDALMATAKTNAAPLYEKAYAAPPVQSPALDELLATPAGKQAIARARTIAANERRDPTALGFALDKDGQVVLNPVGEIGEMGDDLTLTQSPARVKGYSAQTLDYVKRGLDDIVESHRDPVTRRLRLDEAGRAINDVRANLVKELDKVNPDYKAARAAYAGPASANQALQSGRKALNYSDQEIERATGSLSEGDRQQFALGFRTALSDAIDRRTDGADKVGALLGSPRKRKALAKVFGGEDGLDNFIQTMADERLANETYRTVRTGSPTAERGAEDAASNGLIEQGGAALYNAARGNGIGLLRQGVGAVQDFRRFGAGKSAERAREEAAALLSETNPTALRESLREALRQQAILRAKLGARRKTGVGVSAGVGQSAGGIAGSNQ